MIEARSQALSQLMKALWADHEYCKNLLQKETIKTVLGKILVKR